MADTTKKGKGPSTNSKPQAPQKQAQSNNVKEQPKVESKESKQEVVAPVENNDVVAVNPNTNQPDPVVAPKSKAPVKEKVYEQGKGTVKAVHSGDTLVIIQQQPGKAPVEREIQLTNIEAPKLGRRNRNEREADEAFAFASREFLRKSVIGKPVSFTVEQKSTNEKSTREYGYVYTNTDGQTPVDLAQLTVGEGWTRVRRRANKEGTVQPSSNRPEVEELIKLEEEAKEKNKGIHNKAAEKKVVRPVDEVVPTDVYEQLKKAPQQAVVERALTGSTLFLTLLPSYNEVRFILSGVDCPGQSQDSEWEPFGREAKFCTEFYLLNRDVQVILEGADKKSLYGTLDLRGNNISEELLKRGLAKYVDWSGSRTAFAERLKSAEKSAKDKKLNIWGNYVEPKALSKEDKKNIIIPGKEVTGKVTQIISASTILVVDSNNKEWTVQLSSVILPRGGQMKVHTKGEKPKEPQQEKATIVGEVPTAAKAKQQLTKMSDKEKEEREAALERTYAWEAKEYLRRRLIGQRVRCVLDYIQPADQNSNRNQGKGPQREEKDRHCFSVYLEKNNIAVELCAQGLASPRNHRGGEPRSKDYEDMLKAETVAKSQHKGKHQNPEKATPLVINDISSDVDQATKFLPSIKRARQRGVVMYVFNASKLKIYVPKENCELTVSISGIQTPRDKEEFSQESVAFVRERVFQREVEFEANRVDKGGNFGGSVYYNKESVATLLVAEGYAKLLRRNAQELPEYNELDNAENDAKRSRKNLWKDYDEAVEREAREKRNAERNAGKKEEESTNYFDIMVTEIIDATTFFVQKVGPDGDKLIELMKGLSLDDAAAPSDYAPKVTDLVRAQYTQDDQWYRATVTAVEGDKYRVLYVDYGNSEVVPAARVKPLSAKFGQEGLRYQAQKAHLAYVKPPNVKEDYGQEAAETLRDLVEDRTLMAQREYEDETGDLWLSLLDGNTHLAATLVREGLAKVKKPRGGRDVNFLQRRDAIDAIVNSLKKEEKVAKDSRTAIWEFGDVGSDDEDDRSFNKGKKDNKKKPAKDASSPASAPKKA